MLGRAVVSPNDMVRQFDASVGKPDAALDFVAFLDGREWEGRAIPQTKMALRQSWKRSKWYIWKKAKP
jgi:hypothetical protein